MFALKTTRCYSTFRMTRQANKTIFVLKTTIKGEMLEHIWNDNTPKEARDTFMMSFSKKNNTKLQLMENELLSILTHNY